MAMDLSIDVPEDPGYLVCTITGRWITDELMTFMDAVSAEVKKRGFNRLLADMSLVSGPPPEMDRYNVGKYFASVFLGVKIAIVYRKVYANNFFEDTAVNRGAWVKVFPDKQTAMQWLMKGQPNKPDSGNSR
jgi:hypothetical protein